MCEALSVIHKKVEKNHKCLNRCMSTHSLDKLLLIASTKPRLSQLNSSIILGSRGPQSAQFKTIGISPFAIMSMCFQSMDHSRGYWIVRHIFRYLMHPSQFGCLAAVVSRKLTPFQISATTPDLSGEPGEEWQTFKSPGWFTVHSGYKCSTSYEPCCNKPTSDSISLLVIFSCLVRLPEDCESMVVFIF